MHTVQQFIWLLRPSFSFNRTHKPLGHSLGNRKFKRLEPHFQTSATRTQEGTETAVPSAHSQQCTKELIFALPNLDQ